MESRRVEPFDWM